MKMKKHNIKNIILLLLILFVVSFISITYAALNSEMFIDGSAIVKADSDIRITEINLVNATNGAYEAYNSKYTKETITNGVALPNDDSTITYSVKITNKGNQKYVIKNIIIESSNNEDISFETNYFENEIIEKNSTKEIEITYKTTMGSENISNIILKFNFVKAYIISFDANGGSVDTLNKIVLENDTYKELPTPIKDGYSFAGWYTKKDGGERIDSDSIVTILNDQTLYARWQNSNNYYAYNGDYVFDGTNYIDTGIYLFSEENIGKNFEVSFEIKQRVSKNQYPTMVSAMDETGSPWPGIVYRIKSANEDEIAANASNSTKANKTYQNADVNKVSLKRVNNIIYISFNDRFDTRIIDFSSMLPNPFDIPVTFGASLDSAGNPFRYFTGTLANMSVGLYDTSKKIIYSSNNGSNLTYEQYVLGENNTKLIDNTFEKEDYVFAGWNTKADGTGTSYKNKDIIDMSSIDDSMTLYAQWSSGTYNVMFDSNGGTGEMASQTFASGESQNLFNNTYTKTGSNFLKWNTRSDGLGTSYSDGETVRNLSSINGETVTLYALWGNLTEYSGDNVFSGDNYIDTGICLFSEENINKNFEILFEVKELTYVNQYDTIFSIMDETGSPWPGIVFRLSSASNYQVGANVSSSLKKEKNYSNSTYKKVSIKKIENILYISFNDKDNEKFLDMSKLTSFDVPLTFGASLDGSGNPFRYFTGTLSDIKIYVFE